jgi:hypothetical protein
MARVTCDLPILVVILTKIARGKRKTACLVQPAGYYGAARFTTFQSLSGVIARIDLRLCGPSGPVVLLRKGHLAKLREELIKSI